MRRLIGRLLTRLINGLDHAELNLIGAEDFRGRAAVLRSAAKLCDELADGLDELRRKRADKAPEVES